MKTPADGLLKSMGIGRFRRRRMQGDFVRSLPETAARTIFTATVTFATGWVLKKLFEKSIVEKTEEVVGSKPQIQPSKPAVTRADYKAIPQKE